VDRPRHLGPSLVRNPRTRPSLHHARRQMFLLRTPPIREQHELLVIHGSLEEPSSSRTLATSHFFLAGRCSNPPIPFPSLRARAARLFSSHPRQAARGTPGRPSARPSNPPGTSFGPFLSQRFAISAIDSRCGVRGKRSTVPSDRRE
jgi:hypothetical protein